MPVHIVPNGEVGQRAERAADIKRLCAVLSDLRDAHANWESLAAGPRNAALKLVVRAVIALLHERIAALRSSQG